MNIYYCVWWEESSCEEPSPSSEDLMFFCTKEEEANTRMEELSNAYPEDHIYVTTIKVGENGSVYEGITK